MLQTDSKLYLEGRYSGARSNAVVVDGSDDVVFLQTQRLCLTHLVKKRRENKNRYHSVTLLSVCRTNALEKLGENTNTRSEGIEQKKRKRKKRDNLPCA